MKRRSASRRWLTAVSLLCGSLSLSPTVRGQGGDALVMVTSKANSTDALSLSDARKILLGETSSWRNGQKLSVLLKPAGDAERAEVLKKVCGMTETVYTRYEMQAVFNGGNGASVKVVATDAAIKAALKASSSSVGFIHKSAVDDSVKILLVLE